MASEVSVCSLGRMVSCVTSGATSEQTYRAQLSIQLGDPIADMSPRRPVETQVAEDTHLGRVGLVRALQKVLDALGDVGHGAAVGTS